jgi:uncharacterized protein YbcV (DUF1398 family)
MNDTAQAVCETCLRGSYDGTLNFPQQLGMLAGVNVEGYLVDLRTAKQTYYLPNGDTVTLDAEKSGDAIAPAFTAAGVEAAVRQSQVGEHTYRDFLRKVKAAGCSAYMVSMMGRRAVYFGRTGETHVEHFPV